VLRKIKDKRVRYLIIGGVNTVVGFSVYPILYILLCPKYLNYFTTLVVSQLICISVAYVNTKKMVFMTKGGWGPEFLKFIGFHGIIIAANLILLPVMVDRFGINPIVAQTTYSFLIVVSSYGWHSKITFVERKNV